MKSPIPDAALAQHIAVLGKTGSGKTYAVRGSAVEPLLDQGARVCIIDPTGAWNGLRSSATGKSAGYPVVIFGGSHADLPLGAAHGDAIAEVVGSSSTPSILDTSLMKVIERTRFFADFADAIMRKNKGPLHLIIDECHCFLPQGKVVSPQAGEMLAAGNNMLSGGRSRGLRIILISQRPAKVHKDSLTQVETLIAMRLIAPQDRAAVMAWIEDNADKSKAAEIISSLATLKTGQGWIWAPELGLLERVSFPKITTFDSGRAPDGTEPAAKVLAPIDRDAIASKLTAVSASALADDPKALRKEIADLRAKLAAKPVGASTDDLQAAEQRGREAGIDAALKTVRIAQLKMRDELLEVVGAKLRSYELSIDPGTYPDLTVIKPVKTTSNGLKPSISTTYARHKPDISRASAPATNLPVGERAILAACIQYPNGLRRDQLTVIAGYKKSSRDAYIARLAAKGYVESGATVRATDEGRAALPDAEPLPRGRDLQDLWRNKLPVGERKILDAVIEAYPSTIAREALDVGFQKSSRDAYLARLAAKELVTMPSRGEVRASEDLF